MATITGLTAERMLEIEAASIVNATVVDGDLILIKHDGEEINIGPISGPPGPPGPTGPSGLSSIPGEVKLWPGETLPDLATYGEWVWADGTAYDILPNYPLAAANISDAWNNFDGFNLPPAGKFRVPDLRGLVPAGMDAMPGGTRKNRIPRVYADLLAKLVFGEHQHKLIPGELAIHSHGTVSVAGGISGTADSQGAHQHLHRVNHISTMSGGGGQNAVTGIVSTGGTAQAFTDQNGAHGHNVSGSFSGSGTVPNAGSDNPHENLQPTVMVPYIVCLDG